MARIEIFRSGTHTSKDGKTRSWSEADLHQIAEKYNSQKEHEAPVVIGHPKENAPAYGWVESLEAVGDTLFANLKDLAADFVEAVKQRRYPKRSMSLYTDGLLKHVGFLGAVPPAVKGLAEASFREDAADATDFEISFSDEGGNDVDKDKRIEELEKQLAAEKAASRKKDNIAFCEALEKEGKLTPAQRPMVLEFMELTDTTGEYEFSEGKKENATDKLKKFLETLPKQVELDEFAEKSKADKQTKNDSKYVAGASEISKKVHDKAVEFMEKDRNLTYETAAAKAVAEIGGM